MKIDFNLAGKPLAHYWSKCVGAGRANEALRSNWRKQLAKAVHECGFEYIRFHGLLHDDMFVYNIVDGNVAYNFQYIDELFDFLLSINVRPFGELGFMPSALASGEATQFWWRGNITPPRDWEQWGALVEALVKHWRGRYGIEELKKWYFEVWNEANLHGAFWTGGKSDYFKLYATTASAIKSVDAELKVGGPAVSNFVPDSRFECEIEDVNAHITHVLDDLDEAEWKPAWVADFLEYCDHNNLPVDFVSAHPYPTDFALDGHGVISGRSRGVNSTKTDLTVLRQIVKQSAFNSAQIHLTEWSSSPTSRDYSHDCNTAAAFIVKANIESTELVNSLSYWTFTDVFEELGAGNRAFHGGFGLLNFQGIPKPAYHAYRFLHRLGDIEVARGDGFIVTKHSETGKLVALFYNYPSNIKSAVPITSSFEAAREVGQNGNMLKLDITIKGVHENAHFALRIVDELWGNAMEMYKKLDYPNSPTALETELLLEAANNFSVQILTAARDSLTIKYSLNSAAIALLEEI